MKNFKINAITALVVGLNVATAHAERTPSPVPNQMKIKDLVLHSVTKIRSKVNTLTLLVMVMMRMVNKLKALETTIKFMQMDLLDMASIIKLVHNRLMTLLKKLEKPMRIQIPFLCLVQIMQWLERISLL